MLITYYVLPVFLAVVLIIGIKKKSYDSFVNGCKKGIVIALDSFPYILSMIFVTKLLSASLLLIDIFKNVSIPELLFVEGFFRPLSSNASLSVLLDIFNSSDVDSKLAISASILHGATDTAFYVVTVYYGTVGIKKYKNSFFMAFLSNLIIFSLSIIYYYFL